MPRSSFSTARPARKSPCARTPNTVLKRRPLSALRYRERSGPSRLTRCSAFAKRARFRRHLDHHAWRVGRACSMRRAIWRCRCSTTSTNIRTTSATPMLRLRPPSSETFSPRLIDGPEYRRAAALPEDGLSRRFRQGRTDPHLSAILGSAADRCRRERGDLARLPYGPLEPASTAHIPRWSTRLASATSMAPIRSAFDALGPVLPGYRRRDRPFDRVPSIAASTIPTRRCCRIWSAAQRRLPSSRPAPG